MSPGDNLLENIRNGNLEAVTGLLHDLQEEEGLTDLATYAQDTPRYYLHEACALGQEDIVNLLIAYYKDINRPSPKGTPLYLASENGQYNIVDSLLVNKATVTMPTARTDKCPFYVSAFYGWQEILDLLVDSTPGVEEDTFTTRWCLEAAVLGGQGPLVKVWFNKLRRLLNSDDTYKLMPELVTKACQAEHPHIIEYLLTCGAQLSPEIVEQFPETIGEVLAANLLPMAGHNEDESETRRCSTPPDNVFLVAQWSGKNLHLFHEQWLTPYTSALTVLDISSNHLMALPSVVPWGFDNLTRLDLSNNILLALSAPQTRSIACTKLESINLSHNSLQRIPSEIFHLPELKRLDLSHNKILDLAEFQTTADPDIDHIEEKFMQGIDPIYKNAQACIHITREGPKSPVRQSGMISFDQVWSCLSLQYLDLSYNALAELPPQLHMCGELLSLRVANNKLSLLLAPWPCPLEMLDISDNVLTELPDSIDQYWDRTLSKLFVHHNSLTCIPHSVCQLKNLQVLDVSHNELETVPSPEIWQCGRLEELRLAHNKLSYAPSDSSCLLRNMARRVGGSISEDFWSEDPADHPIIFQHSLSDLDLSYNRLRSVPPVVCSLTNLRQLLLNHNPDLQILPPALGNLQECFELGLAGTHIINVPRNLIHSTPQRVRAILAHLKHLLRGAVPFNEIKLMIVGREKKGKSSLVALLKNKSLPKNVATNGIIIHDWKVSGSSAQRKVKDRITRKDFPDVTFQIWDFAGQLDFYITHKLFLSPCAVYLVVYDLRLHREGIKSIKPWLLDIEAHAPHSHVIVVGTFLDYLNKDGRSRLPDLHAEIRKLYQKSHGYPQIDDIVDVSCKTKEGRDTLIEAVFTSAYRMEYRGATRRSPSFSKSTRSEEPVIGRMVPKSYLDLRNEVKLESYSRRRNGRLPILNTDEVLKIASTIPDSDILTMEELDLAVSFLHEAGYILHYDCTLRGLNQLHFTDPSWLADMLSKLITVDEAHQCVKDGLLDLGFAQSLLLKNQTHKSATLGQYVDLLEQFNIALLLDESRLLLPSKLHNTRPSTIDESLTRDNYSVLHRVYYMKCVPTGFWPRIIIQFVTMLQRVCKQIIFPIELSGTERSEPSGKQDLEWERLRISYGSLPLSHRPVHVAYWQQGIALDFQEGALVVEPCKNILPKRQSPEDGVVITVATSSRENYSVMGFAVDQLESIISQWFSGLIDDANPIKRCIPCPGCVDKQERIDVCPEMFLFTVQDCVSQYLADEHVKYQCPKCQKSDITPEELIPDFTLYDLPHYLHLNREDIVFDIQHDLIGSGGEGYVYKGTFGTSMIAYKQSAVYQSIQNCRPQLLESGRIGSGDGLAVLPWELEQSSEIDQSGASMAGHMTRCSTTESVASSLDSVKWLVQYKLLPAFQDFRKEVSLLSTLDHPCVVSLLGVLPPHLGYVMELATLGSLNDVLEQMYREKVELRPLGQPRERTDILLDRMITFKIVYQMASGLEYLHERKVVYKDLKPRNVLVWSLDPDQSTNVKLSDYGLSSYLTPQGVRGCEGTLGYQAPEMRHGSSYNQKVDIFALGMVIFQLFTGMQLFANLPSVIIPKQIQAGLRPDLKDSHLDPDLPKLVALMKTCWASDPSARPVSAEVTAQIRDPSFWTLSRVISPRIELMSCVGLESSGSETSEDVLHLVSGVDASHADACCYSVTPSRGLLGRRRPLANTNKSNVVCMAHIGPALVIGCEDPAIRVYNTHQYKEACTPYETEDVPLAIVYKKVQNPEAFDFAFVRDLLISHADGSVYRYVLCMTSKTVAVLQPMARCHLGVQGQISRPIRCLLLMDEGQQLWAGHGTDLVVMETTELSVISRLKCSAGKDGKSTYVITRMCCHGDQVWLFIRGSHSVIEVDVGSFSKFCQFDCALGSQTGVCTVDWFHETAKGPQQASAIKSQPQASTSAAGPNMPRGIQSPDGDVLVPIKRRSTGTMQRKMSMRFQSIGRRGRGRSSHGDLGRTKREDYREPQYQVRSLVYVNGALWVGRRSGDILVINVTQNNPCNYQYGEVVAVLCSEYLNGYGNGSVEHMSLHGDKVVAIRTVYELDSQGSTVGKSEIIIWKAVNLEEVHKTQTYWHVTE